MSSNINWINPESNDPSNGARSGSSRRPKVSADSMPPTQSVHRNRLQDLYQSRTGVSWQHMSFQLMAYGHKSQEDDVYAYFGDEWYGGAGDTWNKEYIDYAMYLFDRAFTEGGVVSSYWDLSFPILFPNPLSGLAYRLPDGRFQPATTA
jgi:hypothetical protein